MCQRAEHLFAGVPCGIMDMFTSIAGRRGHAVLLDCRSLEHTLIPLPDPAEYSWLIIDTGVKHALAGGEYAQRRAVCESAARRLGVNLLREVDEDMVHAAALSEEERRCARHVVSEIQRTVTAAQALRSNQLGEFGRLMFESHASLRDDFRVSCPELDCLVDAAQRAAGSTGSIVGARMTGGGFGGCVIALVPAPETDAATPMFEHAFAASFGGRRPTIFSASSADGSHPISLESA
mgnify:CR=1 FL=1